MTRETFKNKVYDLSVIAGMNQRYHQTQQNWWWWWDTGAKIVTAVAAIIGLSLGIVSALVAAWPFVDWLGVALSFVAAVAAIVLNVVPFGAWESKSADFLRRWSDLREEIDALDYDLAESMPPSPSMIQALKQCEAKSERLHGSETLANQTLLDKCLAAEERSRGEP